MTRRRRTPSFAELIDEYIGHLLAKGHAQGPAYGYRLHLDDLSRFLGERGVKRIEAVEPDHLLAYQQDLADRKGRTTRRRWTLRAQKDALIVVRGFFRWLVRRQVLVHNPAADIELPHARRPLPPRPLTHRQVERFLASIDVRAPLNVRERAVVETVYSTGLRCAELLGLDLDDLDADGGLLRVRHGKGDKERVVPIGERAVAWVTKYMEEVRPKHLRWPDERALFLSVEGTRLSSSQLHRRLQALGFRHVRRVHLLRHSAATAMLERGAPLPFIQQQLGHQQLSTTTIYTRVTLDALKAVHRRTHPAEKAPRRRTRR